MDLVGAAVIVQVRLSCGHEIELTEPTGSTINFARKRECPQCPRGKRGKKPKRATKDIRDAGGNWTPRVVPAPPTPPSPPYARLIVVPVDEFAAKRRELLDQGWTDELIRKYLVTPHQTPDDAGYRPDYIDPVLRGPARATGQTAEAVRRGRTIRRTDYLAATKDQRPSD